MKRSATHSAQERLNLYLQEHGLRPSQVRDLVLQTAYMLPQPFTARQLTEACAEQRISTGTVYNALEIFVLAHILHATQRQRGRTAIEYEWIASDVVRMQFICQKCGRTHDFQDKAIERMIKERKYSNFTMQHMTLFVYGECKHCRATKTTQDKNK